jgi:Domain of Unknown Function (DUF1206)
VAAPCPSLVSPSPDGPSQDVRGGRRGRPRQVPEQASLAQQPLGPWLLAAVATGFVLYGCFMIVQARYRRLVIR